MTKFLNSVNVLLSSLTAISKCAFELLGESPSNEPVLSSKSPLSESNNSLGFSANCARVAVTLDVWTAPISITLANS